MKYHRLGDVRISSADAVFRESPWNKGIGVIVCLALAAVPITMAIVGRSIIFGVAGGVMLLFTLVFLSMFLKTLSPANWLMRITPADQVVVKYRSFANAHFPTEDLVVFSLERDEMKWVRKLVQTTILPSSDEGGVEKRTTTCLEIGVDPRVTEELEPRLTEERLRKAPPRGAMKVQTKVHDYPVQIPEPGVIRLRWRGRTNWISPKAEAAIAKIGRWAQVQDPRETLTDFLAIKAPDAQAEERIMELAQSGDTIGATRLVRRVYGMSLNEARNFVIELVGRGPA